jgi:P-type conjugative transfer protein TrbJ
MKRFTALLALLITAAALLLPAPAQAQIPVTDALHIATTTWAEGARYAQSAYNIIQHVQALYNQYLQIKYQLQALQKLDLHDWRDIGPLYYQLNGLLNQTETLTYEIDNLDAEFQATFPGSTRYVSFPDDHFRSVTRTLDTLRLNLGVLHQISQDNRGSLQTLGRLQLHVEEAEGTDQTLEALGEFASWQSDELATIGATLRSIANINAVAASFQIDQQARLRQTHTDALAATLSSAESAAAQDQPTYTLVPSWMPPL